MTDYLDARASDPVAMGWMVGSPPPADKRMRFADGSFARFPQSRWAYSHMREFVPTRAVSRGSGPVCPLTPAARPDLDAVSFTPFGAGSVMRWDESLSANYTDGIIVLHRGQLAYERYFGVLDATTPHIAYSVSKSFVATVAATLIHERVLDADAPVGSLVPEVRSSGFADATVRQLLDMTTDLQFTEDYANGESSIWQFSCAGSFRPRPAGYQGPESFWEYLQAIPKGRAHGERFAYRTVNTDMLAWVMRRVTGQTVSDLLAERLWRRLGVEHDGYFTVDTAGVEFAGAALNVTLRDLARFGEMMRLGGCYNGQQIVPTAVVDDITRGGRREHFALAGYALLPGWSYRNMWWVSHNSHGAYTARGIHGQAIYIDPAAEMVIARFASHPLGANVHLDPTSLPAYHAVAEQLRHG